MDSTEKINTLQNYIKSSYIQKIEFAECYYLQSVLTQYITSLQIIYDLLEKIEVAISFSKLNTFHNAIVDPNDLLSEMIQIDKLLINSKFPFEPILENLLMLEKTVEIKSFSKNNQITFLIEIPIVENDGYSYYHLYPLPTPQQNIFKTIIPHSKFLVSNELAYSFFDTQCQEIIPQEFLCHQVHTTSISNKPPCEVQLLKYETNATNCKQIATNIPNTSIQKIEAHQ